MEVEEIISRLSIQAIKAKVELCRIVTAALMRKLESVNLTANERRVACCRWAEVARDGDTLEVALELQRRRKRLAQR